jgi:plastocyanin
MKRSFLGTLVVLGVLAPVTFVPAQRPGADDPSPAEVKATPEYARGEALRPQEQDTVFIQIVADADSVAAKPASVTVRPGQVVVWQSDLGDWRVNFKSMQPFGEGAVSDGIRGERGQRNGKAVRAGAQAGRYKYDIMVRIQGGPPLTADPEVVVDPGDGPGR